MYVYSVWMSAKANISANDRPVTKIKCPMKDQRIPKISLDMNAIVFRS